MHSASYIRQKAYLQSQSAITVIGSGQSAAEIFYDLLQDIEIYGYQLNWMTRSPRFYPLEYTKLTLEMTSPDYVDYFHELSPEKRHHLIAEQKSLYKGINAELINDIYDLLYQKRLVSDIPCQLLTNVALTAIDTSGDKLTLKFNHLEQEYAFEQLTGAVVLGTGYQYRLPDFIQGIKSQIEFDDRGQLAIQRDYGIDVRGDIFIPNAGLHTHGISSPDLGMGCYRNAIILQAVLGYAPYPIETRIAFQTFDPNNITDAKRQPVESNTHSAVTSSKSCQELNPSAKPTQQPSIKPQTVLRISPSGGSASALMAPNKEAQ